MRVKESVKIVPGAVSLEFCDKVIEIGRSIQSMDGNVGYDPDGKTRKSEVSWIPANMKYSWIYDTIGPIVGRVNKEEWGIQLQHVESMQYTRYENEGHYTWHTDARKEPYPDDDKRWPGLVRKVSCSLLLSDDQEFEGGDFEVEDLNSPPDQMEKRIKTLTNARKKGTLIVFPSHIYHRVTPLTGGLRQSLVAWYLGQPYK